MSTHVTTRRRTRAYREIGRIHERSIIILDVPNRRGIYGALPVMREPMDLEARLLCVAMALVIVLYVGMAAWVLLS